MKSLQKFQACDYMNFIHSSPFGMYIIEPNQIKCAIYVCCVLAHVHTMLQQHIISTGIGNMVDTCDVCTSPSCSHSDFMHVMYLHTYVGAAIPSRLTAELEQQKKLYDELLIKTQQLKRLQAVSSKDAK